MASSFELLCIGNMENAIVTSATSEATGYPKENCLDLNMMTAWRPTGTTLERVIIDMGTALQADGVAFFIKNYNTNLYSGGSSQVTSAYSSDGTNWTEWDAAEGVIPNRIGYPLIYGSTVTWLSRTYRYFRVGFQNVAAAPDIAGVFLFRRLLVSVANEYPEADQLSYNNISQVNSQGQRYVVRKSRLPRWTLGRQFTLAVGTTDYDTLLAAYMNCKGDAYPLILVEGTDYDNSRLVRFVDGSFKPNKQSHNFWKPSFTLEQVPYHEPGFGY